MPVWAFPPLLLLHTFAETRKPSPRRGGRPHHPETSPVPSGTNPQLHPDVPRWPSGVPKALEQVDQKGTPAAPA